MNITMKASGIKETAKALGKNHEPAIRYGFDKIGDKALELTREEAPKRSGELRSQIRLKKSRWTWSIVEGPTKHGLWVREGTKKRFVVPVKARALYWVGLPHPVAYANNPGIRNLNNYPQRAHTRLTHNITQVMPLIGRDIVLDIG